MLILPHADGLWINLDKLCQRILQSSCDRSCASLPYIKVRELLGSQLAGRIHRGSCLVDDHVLNLLRNLFEQLHDDHLRLTRGCAISE